MPQPLLHIALPVMNESALLPRTLAALAAQDYAEYAVWACVNQPESWWDDPGKNAVCVDNQRSLELLRDYRAVPTTVIDRNTRGHGWPARRGGVGWARKTIMDAIAAAAGPDDIIVSIDADTVFRPGYLTAVAHGFMANPGAVALTAPYYHALTGTAAVDRLALRYEIFLRYYLLNLFRIGSPYAFTALGSALAVPVRHYRAVGGITPKPAAEDFYFLQKLRKYGRLAQWCEEKVYPAARFSDRVPFGTGAALRRGRAGEWFRYPLYPLRLFADIRETVAAFPDLFVRDCETPLSGFLKQQLHTDDLWGPLRHNHPDRDRFIRACHERLDALRILQYLKTSHRGCPTADEEHLTAWLHAHARAPERYPAAVRAAAGWRFTDLSIAELDTIRTALADDEDAFRKRNG